MNINLTLFAQGITFFAFIWFTVKSVLGLMNLLQDRPA